MWFLWFGEMKSQSLETVGLKPSQEQGDGPCHKEINTLLAGKNRFLVSFEYVT